MNVFDLIERYPFCGTAWDESLPLSRGLSIRAEFPGKQWADKGMESKRRSAILWLRNCSKRGWARDRAKEPR